MPNCKMLSYGVHVVPEVYFFLELTGISIDKINRNLEELAKQIYDYWFVQFDFPNNKGRPYKSSGGKMVWNELLKREIPSGWEVKRVSEVIESVERGISYTFDDIKNVNGIPMLNLACYDKSGEYRSGEFKFFSGKCSNKVYPFEMFIACTDMTQNADIIGRPIFAPTEFKEYVYSMDLAKITPKSISKMYLYYTLRTSFYHKYIKPFASGTNVKHLNINGTERYVISLPAKEEQEKFENTITPIKEKQQNCLKEIQQLSVLRDTLLPLLMNGQVTLNSCLSQHYFHYFVKFNLWEVYVI
ncbi:restriction endonuclease subunit S [Treponema socranskii subsp. buccale]|uniref:restriction endonuclease subunit S n=1 Tax=Treponema socranskii TaxID=53419 RepID=UPI0020A4CCE2|nr:restriction endonuclease subunit S [Treponema socranskii]UTD01561.1 restriction endonuclease subunit S [Treponema socranskii subsp. buccale]